MVADWPDYQWAVNQRLAFLARHNDDGTFRSDALSGASAIPVHDNGGTEFNAGRHGIPTNGTSDAAAALLSTYELELGRG